MSKQHPTRDFPTAPPEHLESLFGHDWHSKKHVVILIDKGTVQSKDVRDLFNACACVPDNAEGQIYFDWDDVPLEEMWRVPEVRQYVRAAVCTLPKLLTTLCVENRRLFRSCFLGSEVSTQKAICNCVRFPQWFRVCEAACISPWE